MIVNQNDDSLQKSAVIRLLKTFSKAEIREFGKFVNSPFHNNRSDVTRFFIQLTKYYPLFTQKDFTDEIIFGKLYPESGYNDSVMRLLKTHLKKLIEDYLAYSQYSKNNAEKQTGLIESLYERKLFSEMGSTIQKTEQLLNTGKDLTSMYFFYKWNLLVKKNNLLLNSGKRMLVIENDGEISKNLIYFFLAELFTNLATLKLSEVDFNMENISSINRKFIECFTPESFMSEINSIPGTEGRFIEALYYAYRSAYDFKNKTLYKKLEKYIYEHSDKFDRRISKNLYNILESVYTVNGSMQKEEFELTKDKIKKDLLSQTPGGYIEMVEIINTINLSAGLKEFDWAEKFIEGCINRVVPGIRNDVYNLCKSLINFHKKDYEEALKYIHKANIEGYQYYTKIITCMSYYLLGYTEELFSFIDSFRHFLKSDKNTEKEKKQGILNFLIYLNKLVKIRDKKDFESLYVLKKNIEENKPSNYSWIMRQVEDIEKNKKGV